MASASSPNVPQHVAIIMDGNGRWAKQRGLPRLEGHRRGVETVREIIDGARELGIRYLTLYAFSVENNRRPQDEVGGLMSLLEYFLDRETATLVKNQVRLLTIGRTQELPDFVRRPLERAIQATAHFTEHTLILALNYGARTELLDAVAAYSRAVAAGAEPAAAPSWETLNRYLYTAAIPDPDLVIRTSGEMRVSNFLLLQSAYAEYVFTPTLWPDFTKEALAVAVADYARRERRFGLTSEQMKPSGA
ncbi:MAG: di-trans,poly-cis-decaprenylcistransferase [Opitutae bacterium]|nr:di-trans,poly-cis-decaprenylcistransferase [Opitutae bacterium]